MLTKIHKTLSVLALTGIFWVQVLPVRAQEAPPPPPPPPPPPVNETTPPPPPSAPPPPSEPTAPPAPTAPPPSPAATAAPTPQPTPTPVVSESQPTPTSGPATSGQINPTPSPTPAGTVENGQSGDTTISTGDATNSAVVVASANDNTLSVADGSGTGINIANTGGGAGSTNSGSVSISDTDSTIQENSAAVANSLDLDSNTGGNSASQNVGSSAILTGDANVSGTVITAANTNVDAVTVSEFNIVDDHQGDYVLDFAANCVSGCGTGNTSVANSGNGANSGNTAALDQNTSDTTLQTNDAIVGNTLVLDANSGNNAASFNTGGDNLISTGDANVAGNALTFANNNLSGNVVFGVVNIYGDLVGDIIFPEEAMSGCCGGDTAVANTSNGANSVNNAASNTTVTDNTFQTNQAVIDNNLVLDAASGSNSTSGNTGGDNLISTGDTSVTAQVLNVANSNVSGGNWWLVLVNEAGQWIGRIMGSPEGTNYAGSEGTEFVVAPDGSITARNAGNGAGSTNNSTVNNTSTNTTTQQNTAVLTNTLNLSANTGGNSTNYNTGGSNGIVTGDATIIANLVNFVNNNITGGGKLFVTVVNVFGSWVGDFVGPGQKKALATNPVDQSTPAENVGGTEPVFDTLTADSALTTPPSPTLPVTTNLLQLQVPDAKTAAGNSSLVRRGRVLAISSDSSPSLVASFTTADIKDAVITPVPTRTRPIIHVNLAWILLVLPFAGILGLRKLRRLPV